MQQNRQAKEMSGPTPGFSLDPHLDYVGMDCLSLPENFSGAAYYIYHLTKNLLQSPRRFNIAVLCKPVHASLFKPLLGKGDRLIQIRLATRLNQLWFYEFRLRPLLISRRVKVFYATHYLCPPADPAYYVIGTFHDMGFLLYPRFYPLVKRTYFGMRMQTFLNRANRAVAVSRTTGEAIRKLFPGHADKVSVCYPGTDHLNAGRQFIEPASDGTPYILAVNTFEKRKNIEFIIRLYSHLRDHYHLDHRLILVGHPANGYKPVMQEIGKSPYRHDITVRNSIPVDQLSAFYHGCDFFVNVSHYEGFGFTPFEAIHHGCPVFVYRNNAVAEIIGEHPYSLPHLDLEKWAETIIAAMRSGYRERMQPQRLAHLHWRNTAENTIRMLDQLISDGKISLVS